MAVDKQEAHARYTQKIDELNRAMVFEYSAVRKAGNPAMTLKNPNHLAYVLSQYSLFPKYIASFLKQARDKAKEAGWDSVSGELTRNLGEELGTETDGVPHYKMLVRGFRDELGADISGILSAPATYRFLNEMRSYIRDHSLERAIGSIYACESSAVPELEIVMDLVNSLSMQTRGSELSETGMLRNFFNMHLNIWEPGHEKGLRTASGVYVVQSEQLECFEQGFRKVMESMDAWWNSMTIKALELGE